MFKQAIITLALIIATKGIAQEQSNRVLNEITLSDTGYELGLQHGKMLKTEIGEIVTKWKAKKLETSMTRTRF